MATKGRLVVGLAGLIAAVALAGTATVATASSSSTSGCVSKATGSLRVSSHCNRSERSVFFGAKGYPGNTGAQGATGPQGQPGAKGPAGTTSSIQYFDGAGQQIGRWFYNATVLIGGHVWTLDTSTGHFTGDYGVSQEFTTANCTGTGYISTGVGGDGAGAADTYTLPSGAIVSVSTGTTITVTAVSYNSTDASSPCQKFDSAYSDQVYSTTTTLTPPGAVALPITLR
jgi:hypothetical protein